MKWYRILAAALSTIVLTAGFPQFASADFTAVKTIYWEETFTKKSIGDLDAVSGWDFTDVSNFVVETDSDGNKYLRHSGEHSGVNRAMFTLPQAVNGGSVVFEMKVRKAEGNQNGGFDFYLRNDTDDREGTWISLVDSGDLYGRDITGGGVEFINSGAVYGDGDWHIMSLRCDIATNNISLQIDGNTLAWNTRYHTNQLDAFWIQFKSGTCDIDDIKIYEPDLLPPTAADVLISGTPEVRNQLSVNYQFTDGNGLEEGNSKFSWYASTAENGNYIAIPGETARQFMPKDMFAGQFVKAAITPVNSAGKEGKTVQSAPVRIDSAVQTLFDESFDGKTLETAYGFSVLGDAQITDGVLVVNDGAAVTKQLDTINASDYAFTFCIKGGAKGAVTLGTPTFLTFIADGSSLQCNGITLLEDFNNTQWYTVTAQMDFITQTYGVMTQNAIISGQSMSANASELCTVTVTGERGVLQIDDIRAVRAGHMSEPPVADNVYISGTVQPYGRITANYEYSDPDGDPEGNTVIRWYAADTVDGSYTLIGVGRELMISTAYIGKHIKASVIPVDSTYTSGREAFSATVWDNCETVECFTDDYSKFEVGGDWFESGDSGKLTAKDGVLYYENQSANRYRAVRRIEQTITNQAFYELSFRNSQGGISFNLIGGSGLITAFGIGGDSITVYGREKPTDEGFGTANATGLRENDWNTISILLDFKTGKVSFYLNNDWKMDRYFAQGTIGAAADIAQMYVESTNTASIEINAQSLKVLKSAEKETALTYSDIQYEIDGKIRPNAVSVTAGEHVKARAVISSYEAESVPVTLLLAAYNGNTLLEMLEYSTEVVPQTNHRPIITPELIMPVGVTRAECILLRNETDGMKLIAPVSTITESGEKEFTATYKRNLDTKTVAVYGTVTPASGSRVLAMVLDSTGKVCGTQLIIPDERGAYNGSMQLSTDVSGGTYTVTIALSNDADKSAKKAEKIEKYSFELPDDRELGNILTAVNSGADAVGLESSIAQYIHSGYLLNEGVLSDYDNYKDRILTLVIQNRDSKPEKQFGSIEEADETLKICTCIVAIANAEKPEEVITRFPEIGVKLDSRYEVIKTDMWRIYKLMTNTQTPNNLDELNNIIAKATVIALVNTTGAGDMDGILTAYNSVLELDLAGDYAGLNKADVGKYLVGKGFTTILEIQQAFSSGVKAVKQNEAGSGRPGGSGGSGGSGGTRGTSGFSYEGPTPAQNSVNNSTPNLTYRDVPENRWSYSVIEDLTKRGILLGNGNGTFEPEGVVTREQFTKMLVLALGYGTDEAQGIEFYDVNPNEWYAPYVRAAFRNKLIDGIGDGMFGVSREISREDMAVMVARAIERLGITPKLVRNYTGFDDAFTISNYAVDSITSLYSWGMLNGVGNNQVAPKESVTREQAAAMISQLLSKIDGRNAG